MNEFLQMDIFFFVTTVVVIVVGILFIVILLQIVRILRHVERLAAMASEEGQLVRADIAQLRASVAREGFKLLFFERFFRNLIPRFKKTRKRDH